MDLLSLEELKELLKPETSLEYHILEAEDFLIGANYGEPRAGHPEGKVVYHIRDVLENVNLFFQNMGREDLRVIALIHDSFKYQVDKTKPKVGENHHGVLARRFAEGFPISPGILDIIELHDEAYNSWARGDRKGAWEGATKRALALISRLGTSLPLFLHFYKCDNRTGDKSPINYQWFETLSKTTL